MKRRRFILPWMIYLFCCQVAVYSFFYLLKINMDSIREYLSACVYLMLTILRLSKHGVQASTGIYPKAMGEVQESLWFWMY